MNDRHRVVKLHGLSINQKVLLIIPSSSFNEESTKISSFFRGVRNCSIHRHECEFPSKLINTDIEFSGRCLLNGSGESCGERESTNPEDIGLSFVDPIVELLNSFDKIIHPTIEGFH